MPYGGTGIADDDTTTLKTDCPGGAVEVRRGRFAVLPCFAALIPLIQGRLDGQEILRGQPSVSDQFRGRTGRTEHLMRRIVSTVGTGSSRLDHWPADMRRIGVLWVAGVIFYGRVVVKLEHGYSIG